MTLTEDEIPLVIEALEHYAFTRAKQNPETGKVSNDEGR